MNKLEEDQIRDYLISKKLPIDILLEVQDHFIAQITELQLAENLDFSAAFAKTKVNWKQELSFSKLFYKIGSAGIPTTNFERKFIREVNYNIFKITAAIFFPFLFFLYWFSFNANQLIFKNTVKGFLIVAMGLCFASVFFNLIFTYWNFKNKLKNHKISVFQWHIFLVFSFGYFGLIYLNPMEVWIDQVLTHHLTTVTFLKLSTYLILIFFYVFTTTNQLKYSKTLHKLKTQLKFT